MTRGIWEPTGHLLQDRRKPRKTSMEMVVAGPCGCVLTYLACRPVFQYTNPPPLRWSLNVWGCSENDVHTRSADVRLVQQQFKVMPAEFYLKFSCVTRKSVLLHRKQSVSITNTNLLTSFPEMMSLCCEIHMKHTNTLCGQNAGFLSVNCLWYLQLALVVYTVTITI